MLDEILVGKLGINCELTFLPHMLFYTRTQKLYFILRSSSGGTADTSVQADVSGILRKEKL